MDFGGTISRNQRHHEEDIPTDIIDEIAELINPHEKMPRIRKPAGTNRVSKVVTPGSPTQDDA